MRKSSPPRARTASATTRWAAALSPRSPCTATALTASSALTASTTSSASCFRSRYPTATLAPARASSSAVARPMPRPPPVTNARLPERSITTPLQNAERGTRNAEQRGERRRRERPPIAVPRSALALPRSSLQPLLHHLADQMFDGEMQLLDPRRVVGRDHERDVGERLELTA